MTAVFFPFEGKVRMPVVKIFAKRWMFSTFSSFPSEIGAIKRFLSTLIPGRRLFFFSPFLLPLMNLSRFPSL